MSLFETPITELLPFDGSAVFHPWVLGDRDASQVFAELNESVPWEARSIRMFGKDIPQPRLVAWFGDPGCEYSYSGISMNLNEWTSQLLELKTLCEEVAGTTFNSTLANLYRNGNDKMSWHSDDEPELGVEPCIASLSLGATRRFKFRHRTTKEVVECSLPSGSLIVMSGLSQKMWEHEVPRETRVTDPRINLTFRTVNNLV